MNLIAKHQVNKGYFFSDGKETVYQIIEFVFSHDTESPAANQIDVKTYIKNDAGEFVSNNKISSLNIEKLHPLKISNQSLLSLLGFQQEDFNGTDIICFKDLYFDSDQASDLRILQDKRNISAYYLKSNCEYIHQIQRVLRDVYMV